LTLCVFSLISHMLLPVSLAKIKCRCRVLHVFNLIKWVNIWRELSAARGFVYYLFLYWSAGVVCATREKKRSVLQPMGTSSQNQKNVMIQNRAWLMIKWSWLLFETRWVCFTKAFPAWKYQMVLQASTTYGANESVAKRAARTMKLSTTCIHNC